MRFVATSSWRAKRNGHASFFGFSPHVRRSLHEPGGVTTFNRVKTVGIREAKTAFCELVDTAKKHDILITKHGKSVALIIGVDDDDYEDVIALLRKKRK